MAAPEIIEGTADLLILVDHASAHVPADIDLGIEPTLLDQHVAIDIGAAPLARLLAIRLGASAILATVSRLVIDLNRELDAPGLIPVASDGHLVPGNRDLSAEARQARIDRFFDPYHAAIAARLAADRPRLIVGLHSFTPRLETCDVPRPWQVGLLWNEDDRATRAALPLLEAQGLCVGDNLPYSGKLLNATINRHAEANAIPYLNFEVRQDLIGDAAGVAAWADILAPVIEKSAETLACAA